MFETSSGLFSESMLSGTACSQHFSALFRKKAGFVSRVAVFWSDISVFSQNLYDLVWLAVNTFPFFSVKKRALFPDLLFFGASLPLCGQNAGLVRDCSEGNTGSCDNHQSPEMRVWSSFAEMSTDSDKGSEDKNKEPPVGSPL